MLMFHLSKGDGYLAHEEFKGMVSSLNIKISGEQIRSVIRAIDLDGGGFIDFPEFEAAVKRHEDVRRKSESVCRVFSPRHRVHNVSTVSACPKSAAIAISVLIERGKGDVGTLGGDCNVTALSRCRAASEALKHTW